MTLCNYDTRIAETSCIGVLIRGQISNPITHWHFYLPQTKLWEGNAFTPARQLFCSQRGETPYWADTPEMVIEGGSAHPTGMHSFIFIFVNKLCNS